ncbi:MAG: hypothetical protein ACO1NO_02590 [Burkholderiaceae bacterium]
MRAVHFCRSDVLSVFHAYAACKRRTCVHPKQARSIAPAEQTLIIDSTLVRTGFGRHMNAMCA